LCALRYFLLREIPFGQDGNFSFDALVQRYNGDLANGYGNLVSRVVNMMHKFFGGLVPETGVTTVSEDSIRSQAELLISNFAEAFDDLNFSEALKMLWALVAETDGYLTANAPWKKPADRSEADHTKLQARVLATAAEAIRIITALVYPVVPDAAAKVWQQLGLGEMADAARQAYLKDLAWGGLKAGTKFGEPAPLFPRAEKDAVERMQNLEDENNRSAVEAAGKKPGMVTPPPAPADPAVATIRRDRGAHVPAGPAEDRPTETTAAPGHPAKPVSAIPVEPVAPEEASRSLSPTPITAVKESEVGQTISIDDFSKVELRVAEVLVAERVPKADKLLRLEVDLGYEKRQILAGIAQYYEPEKLIGRKIIVVANLAPRKMRGLESNGMLLAASLEGGAPVLAGFLEDVPLGARLK
jgi:methionyl-tRNA synthetase